MNFGEMLARGMGVAGWIIGFVAVLGGFLIVVGVIGLALSYALGGKENAPDDDPDEGEEDQEDDDRND